MQPSLEYHCIGKGFCGSIWTTPNSSHLAVKREDGGPSRSITNDHTMHLRTLHSLLLHPPSLPLSIPHCHALLQPTDHWWETHLPRFPSGYSACRVLLTERIPAIPRSISDAVVDLFCGPNTPLSAFVKSNPDDDACLIRPYLGRRRSQQRQDGTSTSRFHRFSLRNVPLHVDQMEKSGLNTTAYVEAMADALALMHWGAGVDANDVEFVLAPPRSGHLSVFQSGFLGVHCMWILDFDCYRVLDVGEVGLEQACAAFWRNDPYYPRPGSGVAADEELWGSFRRRFLMASWGILGQGVGVKWGLVEMLVDMVEEEGRRRKERRERIELGEPGA